MSEMQVGFFVAPTIGTSHEMFQGMAGQRTSA